jgi:hypothetical protein
MKLTLVIKPGLSRFEIGFTSKGECRSIFKLLFFKNKNKNYIVLTNIFYQKNLMNQGLNFNLGYIQN